MTATVSAAAAAESAALLVELTAIRALPRGFGSMRGRALLDETVTRFAGLAVHLGMTPGDVISHVWPLWSGTAVFDQPDAWAWTGWELADEFRDERQAAYRGCSVMKLATERSVRSKTIAAGGTPVAFEGRLELDDPDYAGVDVAAPENTGGLAPYRTLALRTAYALLAGNLAGTGSGAAGTARAETLADAVLGSMLGLASLSSAPLGAANQLRRETELPDRLGLDRETWKTLVKLLFGTQTGLLGLIEAEETGIDITDLTDPRLKSARVAAARL